MSYFKTSHLMQLKNQEFPVAYNEVIGMLDGSEFTEEYVTQALEEALSQDKKLVTLRNMNRRHYLTPTISEMKLERYDCYSSLSSNIRSYLKSPVKEAKEAAKVLNLWLEGYKEVIYRPLLIQQTSLTTQINDDIVSDTRLSDAIGVLGLIEHLDHITSVNNRIIMNVRKRSKDLVAKSRKASELKQFLYKKLLLLFDSIEMAIRLNAGNRDTYLYIVKEINKILDKYNAIVLSRSTRNRNAAEKAESSQEDEMVDIDNNNESADETVEPSNDNPETKSTMKNRSYNLHSFDEGLEMGLNADVQPTENANEDLTSIESALSESVNGNGEAIENMSAKPIVENNDFSSEEDFNSIKNGSDNADIDSKNQEFKDK